MGNWCTKGINEGKWTNRAPLPKYWDVQHIGGAPFTQLYMGADPSTWPDAIPPLTAKFCKAGYARGLCTYWVPVMKEVQAMFEAGKYEYVKDANEMGEGSTQECNGKGILAKYLPWVGAIAGAVVIKAFSPLSDNTNSLLAVAAAYSIYNYFTAVYASNKTVQAGYFHNAALGISVGGGMGAASLLQILDTDMSKEHLEMLVVAGGAAGYVFLMPIVVPLVKEASWLSDWALKFFNDVLGLGNRFLCGVSCGFVDSCKGRNPYNLFEYCAKVAYSVPDLSKEQRAQMFNAVLNMQQGWIAAADLNGTKGNPTGWHFGIFQVNWGCQNSSQIWNDTAWKVGDFLPWPGAKKNASALHAVLTKIKAGKGKIAYPLVTSEVPFKHLITGQQILDDFWNQDMTSFLSQLAIWLPQGPQAADAIPGVVKALPDYKSVHRYEILSAWGVTMGSPDSVFGPGAGTLVNSLWPYDGARCMMARMYLLDGSYPQPNPAKRVIGQWAARNGFAVHHKATPARNYAANLAGPPNSPCSWTSKLPVQASDWSQIVMLSDESTGINDRAQRASSWISEPDWSAMSKAGLQVFMLMQTTPDSPESMDKQVTSQLAAYGAWSGYNLPPHKDQSLLMAWQTTRGPFGTYGDLWSPYVQKWAHWALNGTRPPPPTLTGPFKKLTKPTHTIKHHAPPLKILPPPPATCAQAWAELGTWKGWNNGMQTLRFVIGLYPVPFKTAGCGTTWYALNTIYLVYDTFPKGGNVNTPAMLKKLLTGLTKPKYATTPQTENYGVLDGLQVLTKVKPPQFTDLQGLVAAYTKAIH